MLDQHSLDNIHKKKQSQKMFRPICICMPSSTTPKPSPRGTSELSDDEDEELMQLNLPATTPTTVTPTYHIQMPPNNLRRRISNNRENLLGISTTKISNLTISEDTVDILVPFPSLSYDTTSISSPHIKLKPRYHSTTCKRMYGVSMEICLGDDKHLIVPDNDDTTPIKPIS